MVSPPMADPRERPLRILGRYALYGPIASGGMATVHYGRLLGPVGFSRTVAIKRLHPQFSKDPEFAAMFLDEARVAARIQHPNVVATVDVVATEGELFLVMDYVRGETLSKVARAARKKGLRVPVGVVGGVISGALHGLHAAHEATDTQGQPLHVVHRDVSPQNILVGVDGVSRVLDFGVAKAAARVQTTRDGQMKGKLAYMAPEQLRGGDVDRRVDLFATATVLWEALTGQRLFDGEHAAEILDKILDRPIPPPSAIIPTIPRKLDRVVLQGLARKPSDRFQTARQFAIALEEATPLASPREVGEWVEGAVGDILARRERVVADIESVSSVSELTDLTDTTDGILQPLADRASREEISSRGTSPSELVRRSIADDEGATTVYREGVHGLASNDPPPSLAAATGAPASEHAGADARWDEVTGAGSHRTREQHRQRALAMVAAAMLLMLMVGVGLLLGTNGEELATPSAGAPSRPPAGSGASGASTVPTSPAATAALAPPIEPSALPTEANTDATKPRLPRLFAGAPKPASPARAPQAVRTAAAAPPLAPAPPTAAKAPSPCSPPFFFDGNGIRRIKPGCL